MIEEIPLLTLSREAAKKSLFMAVPLIILIGIADRIMISYPALTQYFFFFIQVFKGVYTVYFPKALYFCRFPPFSKMIFFPQVQ